MADKMQFDLVSPERRLASLEIRAAQIPGADGDMTVMPGHAPLITTLRPGVLRVEGADGQDQTFVIAGGFADVTGDAATVLAERAQPADGLTAEALDGLIAEAAERRGAGVEATAAT